MTAMGPNTLTIEVITAGGVIARTIHDQSELIEALNEQEMHLINMENIYDNAQIELRRTLSVAVLNAWLVVRRRIYLAQNNRHSLIDCLHLLRK